LLVDDERLFQVVDGLVGQRVLADVERAERTVVDERFGQVGADAVGRYVVVGYE
jgi:hypothetical protein